MIVYKIRRRADGLFSTGGAYPSFNKKGKMWTQRGHVTNHLQLVLGRERSYWDCEIVTFELIETEVDTKPVSEYVQERRDEKQRKEQEAKLQREEAQRQARYKEFLRLRQEFENK